MEARRRERRRAARLLVLLAAACGRSGLELDDTQPAGAAAAGSGTGGSPSATAGTGPVTAGVGGAGGVAGKVGSTTAGHGGTAQAGAGRANGGQAGAGGARAVPAKYCPAGAAPAGIDTWLRVDAPASFLDVPSNALELACNGATVPGTIRVAGARLAFVPASDLPSNAQCVATLPSDLMLEGNQRVRAASFPFSTGDLPGTAFALEEPRVIARSNDAGGVVTDGDDILVYFTRGELSYAVSHDGGDSFEEPVLLSTSSDGPYIGDVRVTLRNGVAQFFFRVLPVNSPGYAYYARVEDGLTVLKGPTLFMPEEADVNVVTVGMGSDGQGNLRVLWSGCEIGECPFGDGVWGASSPDGGQTWISQGELASQTNGSPEIAWTSAGFLSAWLTEDGVAVFDSDFEPIVTQSVSGGMPWPFFFEPAGDGNALLSWEEGPGIGIQTTYLSHLRDGSFEPPRAMLTEPDDRTSAIARFAPTRTDRLAMLTCVGDLFGPVTRSLAFAEDGDAFYLPQQLDFLHAAFDDDTGDDTFCPPVALDEGGRIHLLWDRSPPEPAALGSPSSILYARGELSTPCSL